jgi:hypothetical protein
MSSPILADHLARCFAPSLDMPPLSAQPVVLLPSRIAPVAFDDLTQRLRWPVMDLSGGWISLTLDHNDEGRGLGASRIAALEAAIGDGGNRRPFAIVAIAQPASLTPLAQLFLRTIASRESDISSAALATAKDCLRCRVSPAAFRFGRRDNHDTWAAGILTAILTAPPSTGIWAPLM